MQNSQAVKNGAALKILGEKCCEIKDGGQEIPTKTLRNVYGHFLATTFDITTFSPRLLRVAQFFTAWLFLHGSHFLYDTKGPNASF